MLDFSINRINKILEKQNAAFKLINNKNENCSMYINDIENKEIKEMNQKLHNKLKEL